MEKNTQKDIFNKIYKFDEEEADSYTNIKFLEENVLLKPPILEIGCGKGFILEYFKEKSMEIAGVEISEEAVKFIKNKNMKVLIYDGIDLPFGNESFNIILSFDVLEHFDSIKKHLSEVFRTLKTKGIYTFQTPNKIINFPKEILFRGGIRNAKKFHPSVQTYCGLKNNLRNNGFDFKFIKNMPIISKEKYNSLCKKSRLWRFLAIILSKIPSKIIPMFLRPNFWVIAYKR